MHSHFSPLPNGIKRPPRDTVSFPKFSSGASSSSLLSIGFARYESTSVAATGAWPRSSTMYVMPTELMYCVQTSSDSVSRVVDGFTGTKSVTKKNQR